MINWLKTKISKVLNRKAKCCPFIPLTKQEVSVIRKQQCQCLKQTQHYCKTWTDMTVIRVESIVYLSWVMTVIWVESIFTLNLIIIITLLRWNFWSQSSERINEIYTSDRAHSKGIRKTTFTHNIRISDITDGWHYIVDSVIYRLLY